MREFIVQAPIEEAWNHLTNVERWPSWAHHINTVILQPEGRLTETTVGRFRLRGGVRSEFEVSEFGPPSGWKWEGSFLWLSVLYDHQFQTVNADQTKMVWTVDAEGFGVNILGRVFALIYNRNLDMAIPALQAEIKTERMSPGRASV